MNRLNKLFNLAGSDGMKHIILSAILTVVAERKDIACDVVGVIIGAL